MGNWKTTGRRKKEGGTIAAAKLLRCLQLIKLLQTRGVTATEISKHFDISERTVYRYVALFEEVGFPIDKDSRGKFFIVSE